MNTDIEKKFSNYLDNVIWPTTQQKINENWNISGILKKHSNQYLKFDVRSMFSMLDNLFGKKMTTSNKSDKVVFETDKNWIILDTSELNTYILNLNLYENNRVIKLENLISDLNWNIYVNK